MEYYLQGIDIRQVLIQAVLGANDDREVLKKNKSYFSTVEKALEFMAANHFEHYATTSFEVIENNIEVKKGDLLRALRKLKPLAADNSGLVVTNAKHLLYRLALEVIFALGETFATYEREIYPRVYLCFSGQVKTATDLAVVVFLTDYFVDSYYHPERSFSDFMKTHYYGINMKQVSRFFRKTPWADDISPDSVEEAIHDYIEGGIDILTVIKDVC